MYLLNLVLRVECHLLIVSPVYRYWGQVCQYWHGPQWWYSADLTAITTSSVGDNECIVHLHVSFQTCNKKIWNASSLQSHFLFLYRKSHSISLLDYLSNLFLSLWAKKLTCWNKIRYKITVYFDIEELQRKIAENVVVE